MRRTISLLLALVLLLTLCCCGKKNNGTTWQEQYDLGVRYLSEGNYEEAVIAFTAVIKIDSKRPEAYLGLSDAYTEQGDIANAVKVLERGQEQTGDQTIQERLEQLLALQDSGALNSYGVYSYDEQGREIRRAFYRTDGSLVGAWESEYDDVISSRLVKQIEYSEENTVKGWNIYYPVRENSYSLGGLRVEYDANGQVVLGENENCTIAGGMLVQYEKTDSAGGRSVWELVDGRIVRELYYAVDGSLIEQIYNADRELTNDRYYQNGDLIFDDTYEYDDANHTVNCRKWSKTGANRDYQIISRYDEQGRLVEQYNNGAHYIWTYDTDGDMTHTYIDSDGELRYTQTKAHTAIGTRTTTIYPDGSSGGFWEDDIVGNRVEDEHGYTCTRTADGLPLEVYENGALKRSYSYQAETFTITDHQDDTSKTYSMDGMLLTENDGHNNTLYLYDFEGKLVRTLSFANAVS